ncbi:3-deoxy-D-manno-octulosonic acid transferase [Massilia sp. WF1]|uniref:lipid IV(A) 3-deoxy-D-manno-octulosonic acid transferase n=1 Tax=unclassified Massilia TaxID=2609279 RepID=UPI00064A0887|nr:MULTISPECIES: lipid IV(A) 3-deoxy-D-manno-octulosonic acid transferase [unclassified Massilia]ALK98843.1 3-deoxy-D-manno-octulosonic acid transferase [Massilia sp. WG5]KLU38610.1 3-deoxy-D-manno-octulosonic acid transferase [Massilia sp. WF1]
MRLFYSFMWWLALPLVLGRLWWRGRREPGYRSHLGERLGFYGPRPGPDRQLRRTIMVHAVSVGETRAAEPLIEALLRAWPDCRILLTHMTPTGRATGKALFGKHGERVVQSFLPYDTGFMVGRFLRHFTPSICILMETEVWPNLIAGCASHDVPVALVNARLSERSLRRGRRFGGLMMEAARGITLAAAQTEADAARIASLGAPRVAVTGSIKFDVVPPETALQTGAMLRARFAQRPVLLCASTREGEEALILDAWRALADKPAGMLLLLVPRHPQRFDEVARMAEERGLGLARRSALPEQVDSEVLLGDSMGEMFAYYAACDCAFIGGSLLPLGGQNLIEACAVGKPVLVGQHTFNFLQATEEAVEAGAALRVPDADALMSEAARLLGDGAARARMGEQALAFAGRHRGATVRTVELLRQFIR